MRFGFDEIHRVWPCKTYKRDLAVHFEKILASFLLSLISKVMDVSLRTLDTPSLSVLPCTAGTSMNLRKKDRKLGNRCVLENRLLAALESY